MIDKLKNLTTSITDGEHGSLKDKYTCDGYKVASMENIYNCELHLDDELPKVPYQVFNKIQNKSKVKNKSVLITAVGDVGRVALVRDNKIDFCFISGVVIINTDGKKLIPEYLYYYLQTNLAQHQIKYGGSVNSIQKHFVLNDAKEFCVNYPDIKIQQDIVNRLEPIEQKICYNNKIINVLNNKIKESTNARMSY